jgi:hypothetical protein
MYESTCIDQEYKLLEAVREGAVAEVMALLDQGVNIRCKDSVSNK